MDQDRIGPILILGVFTTADADPLLSGGFPVVYADILRLVPIDTTDSDLVLAEF